MGGLFWGGWGERGQGEKEKRKISSLQHWAQKNYHFQNLALAVMYWKELSWTCLVSGGSHLHALDSHELSAGIIETFVKSGFSGMCQIATGMFLPLLQGVCVSACSHGS